MVKSFLFAILSIGCLTAYGSCGRLNERSSQLELSEKPSFAYLPFLSCVLLKSISACNETCSVVGSVYGQPVTSGVCSEYNECLCNLLRTASLEDYWNKKFDSDSVNVLQEIRKDEARSKKVLVVLRKPFQTFQQTVSDLKPLLNENQLKYLQPKDKEAQNIFLAANDDKFEAIKKYVAKQLESLTKFSDNSTTKKKLSGVLESSDGAYFNRIYQEVCRSQNELLIETLNEYNRNHNIQSPACSYKEDEGNVIRLLDVEVVNKLIKPKPSNQPDQRDSNTKL